MPVRPSAEPAVDIVRYDTDRELLPLVLRPYRTHCRYLKTAALTTGPEPGQLTVSGEFEIAESCYIDDTGHFNAVEFNICYNQVAYYLIAKSIKERLIPVLHNVALHDFWHLQLPHILITSLRSRFKREMSRDRFSGSVTLVEQTRLEKSERWNPLVVLGTTCRFWDAAGEASRGDVKIAITSRA